MILLWSNLMWHYNFLSISQQFLLPIFCWTLDEHLHRFACVILRSFSNHNNSTLTMKVTTKSLIKNNILKLLNTRKIFMMLIFLGFTLYLYATYASGMVILSKNHCFSKILGTVNYRSNRERIIFIDREWHVDSLQRKSLWFSAVCDRAIRNYWYKDNHYTI